MIGNEIKEFRNQKGLSSKELAERVNKTASYISRIETNNVKKPRIETLVEILAGLEMNKESIQAFLCKYYSEKEVDEIVKKDKTLYVKAKSENVSSQLNTHFIQNSKSEKQAEPLPLVELQNGKEEILNGLPNRHELSVELSTIANQLYETAMSLVNRQKIDVRYDTIRNSVSQASNRLEIFKVNYALYLEKLMRESDKIEVKS